ncbi:histidine phosphatase family protein [Sulfurimonas sp.]
MKITLVRHGEVVEKYQGKYNGHNDISLSKRGKLQAKKLAQKLQHKKFDTIYCSDLKRAKETLAAFENKQKSIYTKELREKSWGRHEGKSFKEIEAEGIEYENFEQWINALDGESIANFQQRIKKYFNEIITKNKDADDILVITHSGVIKTVLSFYNNCSLEEAFSINLPYGSFIELQLSSSQSF